MRRWVASVIVCTALVAACSSSSRNHALPSQTTLTGSSKAYLSLEALTEAADVVVTGVAAEVQERFVENGGDPANPGWPGLFQSFRVERILKAPAELMGQSDVTLVLSDIDVSQNVDKRDSEKIAPGDRLLLFLRSVSGPVNGRVVTALIPLSSDNGIFDLTNNGTARPRSNNVRWLTQAEALADLRNPGSTTGSGEAGPQQRSGQITFSLDVIGEYVAGRATR